MPFLNLIPGILIANNAFAIGNLLGISAPLAAYLLTKFVPWHMGVGGKPLGWYVIAALINLLLVRYFYRSGREAYARGVLFVTFVATLLLLFVEKLTLT